MQQALIVDDSKTSAAVLGKMLRKHQIDSVKVESAEDALQQLQNLRPQVIFMDHMMPGMDGFDAVKAIKSTPELAHIPIVMHTSKSGDIYVGHARALGAADILSKPASDEALADVLARIGKQQMLEPVLSSPLSLDVEPPSPEVPPPSARPSLDKTPPVTDPKPRTRLWLFAALALMLSLLLSLLVLKQWRQLEQVATERAVLYGMLGQTMTQASRYAFGDAPLGGQRLELLAQALERLNAIGFQGVVQVRGHLGAFCLERLADGRLTLADPALPVSECPLLGLPEAVTERMSRDQSPAFSRFIIRSPLLDNTAVGLEITGAGDTEPLLPYPESLQGLLAGDWNRIAAANTRVEFQFIPVQ